MQSVCVYKVRVVVPAEVRLGVIFFNNLSPLAPFHSFFVLIHSYYNLHPYPKVRLGVIFLITYHQSLLSIHSSC